MQDYSCYIAGIEPRFPAFFDCMKRGAFHTVQAIKAGDKAGDEAKLA